MTMNFHWKRIAGIDQHALEPKHAGQAIPSVRSATPIS
jgi:hypothetical protein